MCPLWISLLMRSSFAAVGFLAARKLRIITHLHPEVRWDRPLARLAGVVTNGFLQSRMIRREWKPGVMHAVIFLGFMALLARKLQLIVIGYHEMFAVPGFGGALLAAGKDTVELAVLAALAYAYWRRYVQKPARLETNREALLILSLITAIKSLLKNGPLSAKALPICGATPRTSNRLPLTSIVLTRIGSTPGSTRLTPGRHHAAASLKTGSAR